MNRATALIAGAALFATGALGTVSPASAAATWDFATAAFTLTDGQASNATVSVTDLQTDGSSARGLVTLTNGRSTCSTRAFSGMTATFSLDGQYNPCSGTVTFSLAKSGLLSVTDSSVYIPTTLLTGPGTGSQQGIGPQVTCVATAGVGDTADVTWTAQGTGITQFSIGVVNGQNGTVDIAGTAGPGRTSVSLAGETPGQLEIAIEVNDDDNAIFSCGQVRYVPVPGLPTIDSLVPASGGSLTVNYTVADPATVQGIEYQLGSGPWQRPGGVAPVNGTGGSFTITGLSPGSQTVTLRSVGLDGVTVTVGSPKSADVPAGRPASSAGSIAIGSSPSKPTPAPPAAPVSTVPGSSNGAGTGTNGALAANTGDAGIDAPCLAEDGTLYPTLYSTVGSQLTMAPNTHGMGAVKSFIVVGGALPAGMQLDRRFGVLYGVTTQAGSWTTTVRATLADGTKSDGQFTTRVDADLQTLQYAAQNIGSVGAGISIAPSTNAPVTGTTYRLVCGTLPAGTKFDASTGRILGIPKTVVARPIPLRVAETSSSGKAAASFIFVVNKAGTHHLSYPAHPHARPGKRITIRPTVSGVGDIAEYRTSIGKLPKGLRLNHQTGVISGRATHAGRTHTITMVAETKGGALLTAAPMKLSLKR